MIFTRRGAALLLAIGALCTFIAAPAEAQSAGKNGNCTCTGSTALWCCADAAGCCTKPLPGATELLECCGAVGPAPPAGTPTTSNTPDVTPTNSSSSLSPTTSAPAPTPKRTIKPTPAPAVSDDESNLTPSPDSETSPEGGSDNSAGTEEVPTEDTTGADGANNSTAADSGNKEKSAASSPFLYTPLAYVTAMAVAGATAYVL